MLDLKKVDLGALAEALEDHSYERGWWLDPESGEVVFWSDYFEEQDEPDPEMRGLRAIDPVPSHEGYGDMQDFIERVRNPHARDLLERAIAGRGAFRRFKDTLFDFPELRDAWFRFHDARFERRAIRWLLDEGLVEEAVAERANCRAARSGCSRALMAVRPARDRKRCDSGSAATLRRPSEKRPPLSAHGRGEMRIPSPTSTC